MKFRLHGFILFLGVLFSGDAYSQESKSMTTKQYIDSFKEIAMDEMRAYGVPASITLGQGILESASGNSKLSKECNNHFGIKCRKNWNGAFCLADDDAKDECFRGYENARQSYRDHSLFLKESSRYAALFEMEPTDFEGWANGLREAGYATNPAYGNILSKLIVKYRLTLYDSMVILGSDFFEAGNSRRMEVNGLPAVAANQGASVQSIAKENQLAEWQVVKFNDLDKEHVINPGEILYLRPKRKTAPEQVHIIKRGESLHDVSQLYAVKLKSLQKLNRLEPGQEPQIGEEIYLQDKRPAPPKVITGTVPMATATSVMKQAKGKPQFDENTHEVQAGETIESIAALYKTSVLNLVRWNDLEYAQVQPGQLLILSPGLKASIAVRSVAESNTELKKTPSIPEFHFVKPGETLFAISRLYNMQVDDLKRINSLNNNAIRAGQKLKLK